MNDTHQNACLARHGREQIVARIISGQTAGVVAAAVAVSIPTLRKWMARFRTGGLAEATVALIVHLRQIL
jgi:hypothetical protein